MCGMGGFVYESQRRLPDGFLLQCAAVLCKVNHHSNLTAVRDLLMSVHRDHCQGFLVMVQALQEHTASPANR